MFRRSVSERRLPLALLVVVGALALFAAGCGDDNGDEGNGGGDVEAELRDSVDEAVDRCREHAEDITIEQLRETVQEACDRIGETLRQDVTTATRQARDNVQRARRNLARDCRRLASRIPGIVRGSVRELCDAVEAATGG